jgi:hypothetical protein
MKGCQSPALSRIEKLGLPETLYPPAALKAYYVPQYAGFANVLDRGYSASLSAFCELFAQSAVVIVCHWPMGSSEDS